MAFVKLGDKEVEFVCTALTPMIYEQEFVSDKNPKITGDLIADTIGKMQVSSDDVLHVTDSGAYVTTVVDYTKVNWRAIPRALWCMLKTKHEIDVGKGRSSKPVPSYVQWEKSLLGCEPDMQLVAYAVQEELQRGLFRAGAAASGKTSEVEEEG